MEINWEISKRLQTVQDGNFRDSFVSQKFINCIISLSYFTALREVPLFTNVILEGTISSFTSFLNPVQEFFFQFLSYVPSSDQQAQQEYFEYLADDIQQLRTPQSWFYIVAWFSHLNNVCWR